MGNNAITSKGILQEYLCLSSKELKSINNRLAKGKQLTSHEKQKLQDFLTKISEAHRKNIRLSIKNRNDKKFIGLITNVYNNIRSKNLFQDTPEFHPALSNIREYLNQIRADKKKNSVENSWQEMMPISPPRQIAQGGERAGASRYPTTLVAAINDSGSVTTLPSQRSAGSVANRRRRRRGGRG